MRPVLAILLIAAAPAGAWQDEGHKVVARIAAEHLSPKARSEVADLLEVANNPRAVADALANASIWADQVNVEGAKANWHFLNLAWQDNRANLAERCEGDDCLTARLRMFAAQLKANDTDEDSQFDDVDALRFVVNFVGDVHQPLHVASNADLGGTCEQLADWVDQAQNIHAVWDGPLVSHLGLDDAALAAELNTEIAALDEADRVQMAAGDIDDWAWEAHRIAVTSVYKRLEIPKMDLAFPASCAEAPDEIRELRVVIDDAYLDEMQPVVREQLKKAGLRLARMLNDILG